MEVIKRVRRYSSSLGNTGNDNSVAFTIFRNKLKEFKLVANKMLHWVKLEEQQKLFKKRYGSYNYII
jgi:hypothetical protein